MNIVRHRWFRFGNLLLALIAGISWFIVPGKVTWQPLIIALSPWIIRIGTKKFPFNRTPLDLFLLIFLITAAIGIWASYDQEVAWSKFWIIVGAIFIYYALVEQSQQDLWLATGIVGFTGVLVAVYFLLTHDWQTWPTDIGILTQLGRKWMAIRPSVSWSALHPNIAGGIIAVLTPFLFVFQIFLWRQQKGLTWLITISIGFVLVGLLLTSSRAAWLALVVALGIWLSWEVSRYVNRDVQLPHNVLLGMGLVIITGLFLLLSFTFVGEPSNIITFLPGSDNITSRLDLVKRTKALAEDFPFTGGGLASFGGLYSHYIVVIPFFLFDYGHNFYLDTLLEQGVLGFFSLVGVMLGSAWLLAISSKPPLERYSLQTSKPRSSQPGEVQLLRWAIFAGLVTMGLHGLVDDALYGYLGTPFLFVVPGMAVAMMVVRQEGLEKNLNNFSRNLRHAAIALGIIFVIVISLVNSLRNRLAAAWYANLGAVQMAQIELADWPTNMWDDGSRVNNLKPAGSLFNQALQFTPDNRTAQHRLGLISLFRREFDMAANYLEAAHRLDANHRGIIKSLGYSYVWLGKIDEAIALLDLIPEARDEMEVYTWWWVTQGRDDLAEQARQMVLYFDSLANDE